MFSRGTDSFFYTTFRNKKKFRLHNNGNFKKYILYIAQYNRSLIIVGLGYCMI